MNPIGSVVVCDAQTPTGTYRRQTRLRPLVEDNVTNKPERNSNQIHGSWLDLTAKVIPEACGDSDLTAEHYMAESSKSSCFDDACTLALDSVTTAAESATTTGLHQFEETKHKVSDLNFPMQIRENEVHGDENGDQSKYSTREKLSSFREEQLNGNEGYTQLTNRKPQTPETMASVSGESCMLGTDSKSWLQLGLGIGRQKADLSNSTEERHTSRSITLVGDSRGSKKDQELLRLLPFQSEHSLVNKILPAFPSIHCPRAGSSSGGEADGNFLPMTFLTSGSKHERLLTDTTHESIGHVEGERSLEFLISAAKKGSEPQQRISYGSVPSQVDSASITPGLPRAYMHITGDRYPHDNRLRNVSSFLQPAACDENLGFVRSNALQQAYHIPASDGRINLSQSYSEHLQLRRAMNSRGGGLPMTPQENQSLLFRPQDLIHTLQSRPGSFVGQTDKIGTATGESDHSNIGRIQKNQIVSQEWQQLAKRIGTNMHFQSVIPGGTVPVGNSPFQYAIEEVEFMQQANYAAQNNRVPWSSKDFRVPSCNPLVQPTVVGSFTSTRDDPINAIKRSNLLPYSEYGASSKLPVSEQSYLVQPWHGPVSGSMYAPHTQRPAAHNAISAEKLKLTSCTRDQPGLWFMLQASDNPSRLLDFTLPQISKGYLRVKDEKVPVSYVKKYLANKLGLACESEVEIICKGQSLDSSLTLQHVRDTIWFPKASPDRTSNQEGDNISHDVPVDVNSFPKDAIMILTYQKKLISMSVKIS
ncbi:hypothetical protein O6H91_07G088300 [Diphasiastrum complanatum]|nr:hypothetical protein O6H91_07G088300 [Diphasiastrum complanatum]